MKVYVVFSSGEVDQQCESIHKTPEGAEAKKTMLETEEGLRIMKNPYYDFSFNYWIETFELEE